MNAGDVVLRVVCAWCGTVEREGDPDAPVSHTICAACMSKYFPAV